MHPERRNGFDRPFQDPKPCFHNLSALPVMAGGEYITDVISFLGRLDLVLGNVDR